MTESPKLLPCPWCGVVHQRINIGRFFHPPFLRYRVVCVTEGCCSQTGWKESEGEARDAWNKRAPDTEREAMARVCEAANAYMAIRHPHGDLLTTTTFSPAMDAAAVALIDAMTALTDLERARKGEG